MFKKNNNLFNNNYLTKINNKIHKIINNNKYNLVFHLIMINNNNNKCKKFNKCKKCKNSNPYNFNLINNKNNSK